MCKLVAFGFLFLSVSALGEISTLKFPSAKYQELKIHNSFGDVQIAPSSRSEIVIAADKKKWGARCKMNVQSDSPQLQVEISDQTWVMDNECRVDLIVSVPSALPIHLRAGNGNVSVKGTKGDLDVKVGTGKIDIQSELKSLSALAASGDISFRGRAENSKLTTGFGNIELNVNEKISGRIVAQSAKGDVVIALPTGSKVYAQTQVGNGQVQNAFSNDKASAEVDVQASTGDGQILIREQ